MAGLVVRLNERRKLASSWSFRTERRPPAFPDEDTRESTHRRKHGNDRLTIFIASSVNETTWGSSVTSMSIAFTRGVRLV